MVGCPTVAATLVVMCCPRRSHCRPRLRASGLHTSRCPAWAPGPRATLQQQPGAAPACCSSSCCWRQLCWWGQRCCCLAQARQVRNGGICRWFKGASRSLDPRLAFSQVVLLNPGPHSRSITTVRECRHQQQRGCRGAATSPQGGTGPAQPWPAPSSDRRCVMQLNTYRKLQGACHRGVCGSHKP